MATADAVVVGFTGALETDTGLVAVFAGAELLPAEAVLLVCRHCE